MVGAEWGRGGTHVPAGGAIPPDTVIDKIDACRVAGPTLGPAVNRFTRCMERERGAGLS